jgi:hypothetical protein
VIVAGVSYSIKSIVYPRKAGKDRLSRFEAGRERGVLARRLVGSPSFGEKGFTFIEVVISCLIMTLLVAAVIHYHSSAGVSRNQGYYLKAVQVARAELDRLRVFFELEPDAGEFNSTQPPPDAQSPPEPICLFTFTDETSIVVPDTIFRVYYESHGYGTELLQSLGADNSARDYHDSYVSAYSSLSDTDEIDRKAYAYYANPDDDTETDYDEGGGSLDASLVVIDDMESPNDPEDDLLGNIGWWVEDVVGVPDCKRITFALQFWYPGQERTEDPEVIVLKSTFVR